jgi:hypothetical protein
VEPKHALISISHAMKAHSLLMQLSQLVDSGSVLQPSSTPLSQIPGSSASQRSKQARQMVQPNTASISETPPGNCASHWSKQSGAEPPAPPPPDVELLVVDPVAELEELWLRLEPSSSSTPPSPMVHAAAIDAVVANKKMPCQVFMKSVL